MHAPHLIGPVAPATFLHEHILDTCSPVELLYTCTVPNICSVP